MSQTDHQVNQRSSQTIFFFVFYTFARWGNKQDEQSITALLDSLCTTEEVKRRDSKMNKEENEGGVDTRQNLLLKIITSH